MSDFPVQTKCALSINELRNGLQVLKEKLIFLRGSL